MDAHAVVAAVLRSRPAFVLVNGAARHPGGVEPAIGVVRALKADAYTAITPLLVVSTPDACAAWLGAGADEVLAGPDDATDGARLLAALRRSARDLAAQPTTRLPAAAAIDAEVERRIAAGVPFAACYADLDHFKEFNDRYGFREGDRMIRVLGRVLHDAARGVAGDDGFVGHIGGDDFMLVLPLEAAEPACALAIEVFDTLVPLQYSEADRRAGYYFGKDRRGQLHRVPLMSLSIGATTNARRRLRDAAEVARLASEMKSFAKARPGSVYAVDRRGDDDHPPAGVLHARPTPAHL